MPRVSKVKSETAKNFEFLNQLKVGMNFFFLTMIAMKCEKKELDVQVGYEKLLKSVLVLQ